jgi:DNA-binding MarR family transcriptional regulator
LWISVSRFRFLDNTVGVDWEAIEERNARRERDEAIVRLPSLLRVASRALDHFLRQLLERDGLDGVTLTSLDVLVAARQGRPVVAIADDLAVTPQAVSQVVSRLERAELVERWPHPTDGRAVLVRTTPAGAELLHRSRAAIADALDIVADELVEGRLPALADDLARIGEVGTEPLPWGPPRR